MSENENLDDAILETVDSDPPPLVPERARLSRSAAVPARRSPVSMLDFLDQITDEAALDAQTALADAYNRAVAKLVGSADVVVVKERGEERTFKKKSAWRKLARFFQVSTQVVQREDSASEDPQGRGHFNALVVVRASTPWGQYAEALGACSTRESRFWTHGPECPECGGPMWDNAPVEGEADNPKLAWKIKARERGELPAFGCKDKNCRGRVDDPDVERELVPNPIAMAKAYHDVYATAETRATNRAISNLIAAGEISAEEVGNGSPANETPTESVVGTETLRPAGRVTKAPMNEAQRTELIKLMKDRSFKGEDTLHDWGASVISGTRHPSRDALEEVLVRVRALPTAFDAEARPEGPEILTEANVADDNKSDDLPF